MSWPLTPDEDARLDRATTKAWGTAARTRTQAVFGRWGGGDLGKHDPQAYRVTPPIPGKVVEKTMASIQFEEKLSRLWKRKSLFRLT